MFDFFPTFSSSSGKSITGAVAMPFISFAAMAFVQWWSSWYPGSEPGGGGYIAQRMMSAKNEKHSLLATLWFTVAHYCLRPWPWIIVGLVSLVMFPDLPANQKEDGFVYVMKAVLPPGLKGLLIAAFLAAYMSTLSTHLNWGTSYLINDFYKRFLKTDASERHYVTVSKITTFLTAAFALYITFFVLDTITGAWEFIIQCGAGTGFVLILRWFWWRLNAWSEITSMVAPFIAFTCLQLFTTITFPFSIFIIVAFTITTTLIVTFLTPPTETTQLETFYRTTRVGGLLWKKISRNLPDVKSDTGFVMLFVDWALGIIMIYAILFGTGKFIFGDILQGSLYLGAGVIAGSFIFADLNRRGWNNLN
jgi:Na+/proline symporter